jgi:hypothetical protein
VRTAPLEATNETTRKIFTDQNLIEIRPMFFVTGLVGLVDTRKSSGHLALAFGGASWTLTLSSTSSTLPGFAPPGWSCSGDGLTEVLQKYLASLLTALRTRARRPIFSLQGGRDSLTLENHPAPGFRIWGSELDADFNFFYPPSAGEGRS